MTANLREKETIKYINMLWDEMKNQQNNGDY